MQHVIVLLRKGQKEQLKKRLKNKQPKKLLKKYINAQKKLSTEILISKTTTMKTLKKKTELQKLEIIEENTFEMGNLAFDLFLNHNGGLTSLNASTRSYNTTMRAIRYKGSYTNKKGGTSDEV